MRVGILSDTHGFVDPRLAAAFAGVDVIFHAGDVGGQHVLHALLSLAPVSHAVRGNNDEKLGGLGLPEQHLVEIAGVRFQLVHQLEGIAVEPTANVVVVGHSHKASVGEREGRTYINPGAAGRVGFHRTQTVAVVEIDRGGLTVRIVELGPREKDAR